MALLANCHRDPRRCHVFRPSDFDPFAKYAGPTRVSVDDLKLAFAKPDAPS